MSRKITLNEVAQKAEVSAATAARVVHANGYVSQANRERVEAAIAELGYRPNIQARGLRNSRSYTIGVILSSATANPFFTNVSHALRMAANAQGLSVLNFNHNYDQKVEREGIARFLDHNVEAVIACHVFDPRNLQPIIDAGTPIVEIERQVLPTAHRLLLDPAPGMLEAVRHLAAAGHERITFLGGIARYDDSGVTNAQSVEHQRRLAFLDAIRSCGLPVAGARVDETAYDDVDMSSPLHGLIWGRTALAGPDRPTAVIAGSDVLAAGVLQAAQILGLNVPSDLAVIGYDDSLARFLSPPLASIAQPYQQLGVAAIEMAQKAGSAKTPLKQTLFTHLTLR